MIMVSATSAGSKPKGARNPRLNRALWATTFGSVRIGKSLAGSTLWQFTVYVAAWVAKESSLMESLRGSNPVVSKSKTTSRVLKVRHHTGKLVLGGYESASHLSWFSILVAHT